MVHNHIHLTRTPAKVRMIMDSMAENLFWVFIRFLVDVDPTTVRLVRVRMI